MDATLAHEKRRLGLVVRGDGSALLPLFDAGVREKEAALKDADARSMFLDPSTAPMSVRIRWDLLSASYVGLANHAHDVGVVRCDTALHSGQSIPYFEVLLELEEDVDHAQALAPIDVSVGLVSKHFPQNWHIGTAKTSYGYRGVDGCTVSCHLPSASADSAPTTTEAPFGSIIRSGDVIGCGLRLPSREVFFTRNGENQGLAFRLESSAEGLFPAVGLHQRHVKATFRFCGSSPRDAGFAFCPDELVEEQQRDERAQIDAQHINRAHVKLLVQEYLRSQGYAETLKTFSEEAKELDGDADEAAGLECERTAEKAAPSSYSSPGKPTVDSPSARSLFERNGAQVNTAPSEANVWPPPQSPARPLAVASYSSFPESQALSRLNRMSQLVASISAEEHMGSEIATQRPQVPTSESNAASELDRFIQSSSSASSSRQGAQPESQKDQEGGLSRRLWLLASSNGSPDDTNGVSHRRLSSIIASYRDSWAGRLSDEELLSRSEIRSLLRRRRALDALRASRNHVIRGQNMDERNLELGDEEASDFAQSNVLPPRVTFLLHCQRIIESLRAGKPDKALRIARREVHPFVAALSLAEAARKEEDEMDVDEPEAFHASKKSRRDASNGHPGTVKPKIQSGLAILWRSSLGNAADDRSQRETELVLFFRGLPDDERMWYRCKVSDETKTYEGAITDKRVSAVVPQAGQIAALLALAPQASAEQISGSLGSSLAAGEPADEDALSRHPYLVQFSREHAELVADFVNQTLRPEPSLLENLTKELAASAQLRRELAGGLVGAFHFPAIDDLAS